MGFLRFWKQVMMQMQDKTLQDKAAAHAHLVSLGIAEVTVGLMMKEMREEEVKGKRASFTSILSTHSKAEAFLQFAKWDVCRLPSLWIGLYKSEVGGRYASS
jgi:hypothetical protein